MKMRPYQNSIKHSIKNQTFLMYASPGIGKSCSKYDFITQNIKTPYPKGFQKIHCHHYNIIFFQINNKKYFYYPPLKEITKEYSIQKKFIKNSQNWIHDMLNNKDDLNSIKSFLLKLANININPYIDLCKITNLHPKYFKDIFSIALAQPSHLIAYGISKNLTDSDVEYILDNMMAHESSLKTRQLSKKLLKSLNLK